MGRLNVAQDCVGYGQQRRKWLRDEALHLKGPDCHPTRINSRDREYENHVPSVLNGACRLPKEALSNHRSLIADLLMLSLNENLIAVLES
jgi:hypothetical protein